MQVRKTSFPLCDDPELLTFSRNVTNGDSVYSGLSKLAEMRLPPVFGISFGSLVLQDVMLKNMD